VETNADALLERGRREGWEGIIAKRASSKYQAGERSRDWLKLKLENRQELVIGGWTEPRKSRQYLGAILLGYYDADGNFVYAGHTGTGFRQQTLEELYRRLKPLERKTPPFSTRPQTNEKAHWVSPRVVAEIKFNEWTRDGKLRQPVFVGIRDDKDAREVVREPAGRLDGGEPTEAKHDGRRPKGAERGSGVEASGVEASKDGSRANRGKGSKGDARTARAVGGRTERTEGSKRTARAGGSKAPRDRGRTTSKGRAGSEAGGLPEPPAFRALRKLSETNGGELKHGRDTSIPVTNLDKVF
jgi:bifunctional non-homologous end joining protein LigD